MRGKAHLFHHTPCQVFGEKQRGDAHAAAAEIFEYAHTNVTKMKNQSMIVVPLQARPAQLGAAELAPRWKSLFMPSWERQLPHKHGVDRTQLISY